MRSIQERQNQSWQRIRVGLDKLERYGPDPQVSTFKRLKHLEGFELWELRTAGSPAYRVLFSPVPDEEAAFVILSVVLKSEMDRDSKKYIDDAIVRFEHWFSIR